MRLTVRGRGHGSFTIHSYAVAGHDMHHYGRTPRRLSAHSLDLKDSVLVGATRPFAAKWALSLLRRATVNKPVVSSGSSSFAWCRTPLGF